MGLPLVFLWFKGPTESRGADAGVGLELSSAVSYMKVSGTMHWGQPPVPLANKPAEMEYQQELQTICVIFCSSWVLCGVL